MKRIKLLIYLIILISLLPSCKTQCQILEEQIDICQTYLNCDNDNDLVCIEVKKAKSLIETINNKITDGTDDKSNVEDACSYTIANININDCVDAQKVQFTDWQTIKKLMANFGLDSSINKINREVTIKTTPKTETEHKCGKKILKDYSSLSESEKQIRISTMEKFSEEVVPIMQVYKSSASSNVFIGDKYIKNENSPCDFNKNDRFKLDDYKAYDYIFCSKSSGWLSETETTQSNCALTRQEVFLLNWKKDYFIEWCIKNYKNTSCTNGNDYLCAHEANKACYELKEKFFCKNNYEICFSDCARSIVCQNSCKQEYIECKNDSNANNCKIRCQIDKCYIQDPEYLRECFENYGCCSNCSDDGICTADCIKENIDIATCYNNNIKEIENCFYNKIKESTSGALYECLIDENTESECSENCNYDSCIYTCLDSECPEDYECFERSNSINFFDLEIGDKDNSCINHACYYNCQEKCATLEIDATKSTIMTVYREVDDEITGSNCDETEIFETNEDYCVIEHEITNEEGK